MKHRNGEDETAWQKFLEDNTLPKVVVDDIKEEIENAKKVNEIEKLNDIFEDEFWIREIEVDG